MYQLMTFEILWYQLFNIFKQENQLAYKGKSRLVSCFSSTVDNTRSQQECSQALREIAQENFEAKGRTKETARAENIICKMMTEVIPNMSVTLIIHWKMLKGLKYETLNICQVQEKWEKKHYSNKIEFITLTYSSIMDEVLACHLEVTVLPYRDVMAFHWFLWAPSIAPRAPASLLWTQTVISCQQPLGS